MSQDLGQEPETRGSSPGLRSLAAEIVGLAPTTGESQSVTDGDGGTRDAANEEDGEDGQASDNGEGRSDEEDDEPRLKYARLTPQFAGVYRNGDSTSAFTVAGEKMVGCYTYEPAICVLT